MAVISLAGTQWGGVQRTGDSRRRAAAGGGGRRAAAGRQREVLHLEARGALSEF